MYDANNFFLTWISLEIQRTFQNYFRSQKGELARHKAIRNLLLNVWLILKTENINQKTRRQHIGHEAILQICKT